MLKKLLFGLGLALSCPAALLAQRTCGTMDHLENLEQEAPGTKARLQQLDHMLAGVQSQHLKTNAIITIPVVVHVVYRTTTQNISDAQIQSQIDVLNEDFNKKNADGINTPAPFKPLAGDMQIRFELAKRDPFGNPTNGITRTQTSVNGFGLNNGVKFTNQGGHDAWDREKYLNIWVCSIGGGILGYAQFPGTGSAATDGVVIGYNYFGRVGTLSAPFNKGRTATHEVGHWLGLYHIWGDEPGCSNDDQVADTPLQRGENYGCPSFPKISGSGTSCTAGSPGAMFMNYMDYVDDACMNMFTQGQVNRARNMLQNLRPNIIYSDGALPTTIKPLDAAIVRINAPAGISCNPQITPKIVLKNQGSQVLNTATINYQINNGPVQTLSWLGSLRTFETTEINLPVSTVGFGRHNLSVTVAAPNGGTDGEPADNKLVVDFTVTEQKPGLALPFREGFESATFAPQGWEIANQEANLTWARTDKAAFEGTHSAFMNNFDYENVGETDELQLPALDLSTVTEPKLRFSLAYTATSFGSTANADTLEILASADCGLTFKSLYKKSGRELATILNTVTSPFFPDNSQWRTDSVDLAEFNGQNSLLLKFRNVSGSENNLFLDDVNVTGKIAQQQPPVVVGIYPNPSTGNFTLQLSPDHVGEVTVNVLNSIGKEIMNLKAVPVEGKINLNLNGKADGIYLLHIIAGPQVWKEKLLLDQRSQ